MLPIILVTGATGHIGNVLVRMLHAKGEKLRLLVPGSEKLLPLDGISAEIRCGDIRDPEAVNAAVAGCDYVYHLAGMIQIVGGDTRKLYEININGTKNVVEACLANKVKRLVYVSSVHALDELPKGEVIDENAFVMRELKKDKKGRYILGDNLAGAYANSKAAATLEVMRGVERGLDAVVVFPSGIIGPYDYKLSEFGSYIRSLSKPGKKIGMYFDGKYDFVDVRDVAEALISAMEKGESGQGYVLSGHILTIQELNDAVKEVSKSLNVLVKLPLRVVKLFAFLTEPFYVMTRKKAIITKYSIDVLNSNCQFSNEKARKALGFNPRPLKISIQDSAKWFERNMPHKPMLVLRRKRAASVSLF